MHDGLAGIYRGAGLVPEDIEARLVELVGQLDACGLPDDVRDDIEAVVAEIEEGRGRSREVSTRLARIQRDNVGTCAQAAAGVAAALGLNG